MTNMTLKSAIFGNSGISLSSAHADCLVFATCVSNESGKLS
jgi:hypothetical protein